MYIPRFSLACKCGCIVSDSAKQMFTNEVEDEHRAKL